MPSLKPALSALSGPVVVVGYTGRMSSLIRTIALENGADVKVYSNQAPASLKVDQFIGASGIIDFSLPSAIQEIAEKAAAAKVPLISGTTGWASHSEVKGLFSDTASKVAVVWDSNFSAGIELLCQMSELATKTLKTSALITDIHHQHKRDTPSGTAIKISDRIESISKSKSEIKSERIGEVPGEHRVSFQVGDEILEITHRALSRRPFAEGALYALVWAQKQKPGFYSMKDVLK